MDGVCDDAKELGQFPGHQQCKTWSRGKVCVGHKVVEALDRVVLVDSDMLEAFGYIGLLDIDVVVGELYPQAGQC